MTLYEICKEIAKVEMGLMYNEIAFSYDKLMCVLKPGHPADILDDIFYNVNNAVVLEKELSIEAVRELLNNLKDFKDAFQIKELSKPIKALENYVKEVSKNEEQVHSKRVYAQYVKSSANKQWHMYKICAEKDKYLFARIAKDTIEDLTTPNGKLVATLYPELADRILNDLNEFGYNYKSAESILSWHFTLVQNFSEMTHKQLKCYIESCFLTETDWTVENALIDDDWLSIFGRNYENNEKIKNWFAKCTHMQLTAACCIGNAYNTLNIAYVLANLMELYKDEQRNIAFQNLSVFIASNPKSFVSASELYKDFVTFELYYGFHLQENGLIISNKDSEIYKFLLTDKLV